MKKLLFTTVLCLIAGFSFAQKKALNEAKNEIKNNNPNFTEARANIQSALKDTDTKDLAETWYVAGSIENKQFDMESTKALIPNNPVKPDDKVMYEALWNSMPYFLQADSLDQLPDAKGKVKPKYRKDMKAIITTNRPHFINGGAYYLDEKDYKMAYNFFDMYLNIPEFEMFKGDKEAAIKFVKDSLYIQIQYYAAVSASQMGESKKAIALYEELKEKDYNTDEVYKFLCYEYDQIQDSISMLRTFKEGVVKFPSDTYYLYNLINLYNAALQYDEAIQYLTQAIEDNPQNAQLYNVLGIVYENTKEIEQAKSAFAQSMEIDPDYADAIGNYGRLFFNEALEDQTRANDIVDNTEYRNAIAQVKEKFKFALPYFEKAHQLKPEERDYMMGLRAIYYSLSMNAEFERVEAELEASGVVTDDN